VNLRHLLVDLLLDPGLPNNNDVLNRGYLAILHLQSLELQHTVTGARSSLDVNGCFVFIGFRPNSGLIKGHFRHDASGYIITDDRMMTSIPGLFAAGDLRVQLTRQVTTAVGDATTAAIAVEKYLKSLHAERAAAVEPADAAALGARA